MNKNYKSLDIESLVILLKNNDDELAYQELFYKFQSRVYLYIIKIVGDDILAEEILLESFLKIWNYRSKIDSSKPFDKLLFKITKNTVLDFLRSKKVRLLSEDSIVHLVSHICPEDDLIWDDYLKILNEAIETLPERCRIIFQKSRIDGLSYEEIAQDLNISKNTVRLQIVKSLKVLKGYLKMHPEVDIVFFSIFHFFLFFSTFE
ncbi:RNA polymerase sigma factor [Leeuwenhoekiella aestuarii]|nr:RNA polymerase sigma-70 factor [Leeuwenhoekiella aestuarii]